MCTACQDNFPDVSSGCDLASSSVNGSVPTPDVSSGVNGASHTRGVPVAAGQIYEVGIDGRLTVEWVDGSRSKCLSHQLYLVSDEVRSVIMCSVSHKSLEWLIRLQKMERIYLLLHNL